MSSIGLPRNYRITAKNDTGETLNAGDLTVMARRVKLDTNGALSFESTEATLLSISADLTNGSYVSGSGVDNSTNGWMGGELEITITTASATSGGVEIWLDASTDGGTTWPDNGKGILLAYAKVTATGANVTVISV